MTKWTAGVLAAAVLLSGAPQGRPRQDDLPNPLGQDAVAIAEGKRLFADACGVCHGPTGQGGRGPNLADGGEIRRATNRRLYDTIRKGLAGTEMAPSSLDDTALWQIISFLRDLNASAFESQVAGDAAAGKALFFGKGRCSECHMIRGQGGFLGPDLANIGLARSLGKLREAILDPSAAIDPAYRGVTVVTAAGKIEGVARNHSNYSLQVIDAQGKLHLLARADWQKVEWHEKSLMPRVSLAPAEFDNLLAFLSRQSTGSVDRQPPGEEE